MFHRNTRRVATGNGEATWPNGADHTLDETGPWLRRDRVRRADLGYLAEEELFKALRPKPMRIVFLLPAGTNPYLRLRGEKF